MDRELVTPEELLRRADSIKAMSISEPFKWLVEAAKRDCHRTWEQSKTVEERERAFSELVGVRSLEKQVQKVVDAGIAAARAIEKAQEQAKKEQAKQL